MTISRAIHSRLSGLAFILCSWIGRNPASSSSFGNSGGSLRPSMCSACCLSPAMRDPIASGLKATSSSRALRIGFTVAPILAGADKFFHVLANWDMYLAPSVEKLLPMNGHTFMLIVGGIEIVAGLLVAIVPRIGGFVVSAWLCGIIVNLLLIPGFYDVALRDLGLAIGACALGLLAREFGRPATRSASRT